MSLTNEQLFDLIEDGNEDLKPVLWERVKKLAYMFASQFYRRNGELCRSRGFEEWDIKQLSYIAYASLFETYSTDKNYAYSTALGYALRNELRAALGKKADVLSWENSSLDDTIGEEEDGQLIEETVADENSSAPFEEIEDSSEQEAIGKTLHEEIGKLPERQQEIINGYYFDSKTFAAIAQELNLSRERINQLHKKALKTLKNPRILRRLQDDLGYSSYKLYNGHNNVEYIATERAYLESIAEQEQLTEEEAYQKRCEDFDKRLQAFLEEDRKRMEQDYKELCTEIKRIYNFDYDSFSKAYKENKEQARADFDSYFFEDTNSTPWIRIQD